MKRISLSFVAHNKISIAIVHSPTGIRTQNITPASPGATEPGRYGPILGDKSRDVPNVSKRTFVLSFFFLFIISAVKAQINVPVDLHTGNPAINIPIYTITNGDVAVPVSLYYTPGVPVSEQNGGDAYNAGIGWGVSAGGSITRTVRGLPDDFKGSGADTRLGWLYGTTAGTIAGWNPTAHTDCLSDANNYAVLSGFTNNNADTEPDVFNFNFGGYSGQFMFDNNKIIQTLPYQDLKITPTYAANGSISAFTIIANNGIQYQFTPTTTITTSISPVVSGSSNSVLYLRDKLIKYTLSTTFTTTWGLSNITSPAGASILIYYTTAAADSIVTPTNIFLSGYKRPLYNVTNSFVQSVVSGIVGGDHVLTFNYASDMSLNNLVALVTGNTIGSGTLFTTTLGFNTLNNRKYLVSVQSSNNCTKNPPYQFSYIGVDFNAGTATLPAPGIGGGHYCSGTYCYNQAAVYQYQSDYWGYYNANGATTLCPNLYVYPNEPVQERYRLEQIPNYSGTYDYLSGGADRRVNPTAITAGTLFQITYPTGGNVKIDYEPNQYFDTKANQTFNGGGIRVKTVTMYDGINSANNIIKNYTYSGGLLLNRPQYAIPIPIFTDYSNNLSTIEQYSDEPTKTQFFTARTEFDQNPYNFDGSNVVYQSGAEIQSGKGKTVYNFTTPATYGAITSPEYSSPNQWQATYSRYANTSNPNGGCMSIGMAADGYYGFPFPSNPNYTFERGLLTSTQKYSESGHLVQEKDYTYTPIYQGTAPNYIYGVAYDFFTYSPGDINTRLYNYGKYSLYTGINKLQVTEKDVTYDPTNYSVSASIQTNYNYAAANHTLLSSVSSSASNDATNYTTYVTRYKYPQDYTSSLTAGADSASVAIQTLTNNYMNSAIVENTASIIKPGQSEQITKAGLNIYKVFNISGSNKVLPYKSLALRTNAPVSSFQQSTVNGSYQFVKDNRYQLVNSYVDYNNIGNVYSTNDGRHNLSGVLYDITGTSPIAKISNALASQVVYSNFDDEKPGNLTGPTTYSFDHTTNTGYSPVPGRVGNAVSVAANFAFQKNSVSKGVGNSYIFSYWIYSTTTGNMTVTLTDGSGNTSGPVVIPYTNTTGVWTHYKVAIPVTNLNATFNITAQTNAAVWVDDLLFYPSAAHVSLTAYQNFQKIAETDPFGNTTFYTNDAMGRPVVVTDQNQNILKRMIYNYNIAYPLNAYFSMPPAGTANTTITFNAASDPCEPAGIVRNWDFGDGTTLANGGTNPTHVYTASGTYTVKLTVTSTAYGTVSSAQNITITYPQVTFNLYACGIVADNLCISGANGILGYGRNASGTCTGGPLGSNTFTASPIQDCGNGAGSTYSWDMAYDTAPNTWIALTGNTNTMTVNLPLTNGSVNVSQSYTIRCTMHPNCSAQSSVQTYHILYIAPGCNHQ